MVQPKPHSLTELQTLPSGWSEATLQSLLAMPIQNGLFNEPSRKGRGCKLVNVIDLYGGFPLKGVGLELFDATKDELSRFQVQEGDIFFTRSSLTPEGIAHCNIYDGVSGDAVVFDSHVVRVRVNPLKAEPSFVARYCLSGSARKHLVTNAKTTTMTTVDQAVIASLPVAVPPLPEQRAIAAALADADALIAAMEGMIAKKRDLKQAAMQHLLNGKTRLPGFSGEWEMKRLGDVANIKTGKRNNQDKQDDGAFPFFVRSETVERINSYSHDCEAILIPGEGNIGSIFHYIVGKFDVHQRVYAITNFIAGVSGKFVHLWMRMNFGAHAMQNTVKATVDSLRLPTFQNFELLFPPTFEEQTAIAEVLSDMDADLAALESQAAKARAVKQGMMQELLTGRVRLV